MDGADGRSAEKNLGGKRDGVFEWQNIGNRTRPRGQRFYRNQSSAQHDFGKVVHAENAHEFGGPQRSQWKGIGHHETENMGEQHGNEEIGREVNRRMPELAAIGDKKQDDKRYE